MTRDEFFAALCQRFGWDATPWRLAVFTHWATQEGMPYDVTFNPLATTRLSPSINLNLTYDQGFGPGNWNSVPVRVYATALDGIRATQETLALDFYPNIRRCFADQVGHAEAVPEFTTYVGSESYGQRVVAFMNSTDASKEGDMTPDEVRAIAKDVARNEIARIVTALCKDDEALLASWNQIGATGGLIGYIDRVNASLVEHKRNHPGAPGSLMRGETVKLD